MAGALGGLLLAPKSGKETREDIAKAAKEISDSMKTKTEDTKDRVRDVFGNVSTDAQNKYNETRMAVIDKVAALKNAGQEIDKERYAEIVDEVLGNFKDDFRSAKANISRMANYMKKDWLRVKKAITA